MRLACAATDILREAHVARQPRVALQGTTEYGSFSHNVHKLKLVYAANLKQCLFQEASEGHAQSVRDLADIITAKLKILDAEASQRGVESMEMMLQYLLEEFQWDICAQISRNV